MPDLQTAPPAEAATAALPTTPAADIPQPHQTPNLNDAFSTLDKILEEGAPAEEAPAKTTPAKPGKQEASNEQVQDEPKVEQNGDKKVEKETKAEPPKQEKASTLREAKDRAEKRAEEAERKHKELEKKLALPKDDPEKKELSEKVPKLQKQIEELQEKLRLANYEESDEYKNTHWKPYEAAYVAGRKSLAALKTIEVKNESGEVIQPSRQATAADFDKIMGEDDEQAAELIEKLFGTGAKAQIVANARFKAQEANSSRLAAIDKHKGEGAERSKQAVEKTAAEQRQFAEQFRSEITAGAEKYPKLFKAIEGDDKGNTMLEEGMMMADLAFEVLDATDFDKLPKWIQERMVNGELPQAEKIKLHSAIRNMAGGFNRAAYRIGMLEKQNKELETKLKEYEDSEPGGGEAKRVAAAVRGGTPSADQMIDEMAGQNG